MPRHRVAAVAVSTVIFNLVLVGVLVYVMVHHVPLFYVGVWLSMAIVVGGADPVHDHQRRLARDRQPLPARARARQPDQGGAFFKRALPGLIAAGTPQLKLIAATALVSSSPAAVSWLYYANRLYELPLGVASIAIAAVIVPRIAASVHAGDSAAYATRSRAPTRSRSAWRCRRRPALRCWRRQIAGGLFEHGAVRRDATPRRSPPR